jgi:hypothetical protein
MSRLLGRDACENISSHIELQACNYFFYFKVCGHSRHFYLFILYFPHYNIHPGVGLRLLGIILSWV